MSTPGHHHPTWSRRRLGGVPRDTDAWPLSTLLLLAGGWLVISPTVLGYRDGDPIWSELVFGALIAFVAFVRLTRSVAVPALGWVKAAFGAWIFLSAFWLAQSTTAIWNELLTGAAVFMLAVLSTSVRPGDDTRRAGDR